MLVKIRFEYDRKFTLEEQQELKKICLGETKFYPADHKDETYRNRLEWGSTVIAAHSLLEPFKPFIIEEIIDNASTKKIIELGNTHTTTINEKCHVSVAGLGLLMIKEVKAMKDLCTESLQEELDQGWQIIAICVQPDQRRPDYILGRTKTGET